MQKIQCQFTTYLFVFISETRIRMRALSHTKNSSKIYIIAQAV